MSAVTAVMSGAQAAAALAWLATAGALWRGPGVLAFFGRRRIDWERPETWLVAALLGVALWLLVRRRTRGILLGRATLWSIVVGFVFVWIGGAMGFFAPGGWTVWTGPLILGLSLLVLSSEPLLLGEE